LCVVLTTVLLLNSCQEQLTLSLCHCETKSCHTKVIQTSSAAFFMCSRGVIALTNSAHVSVFGR